MPGNSFGQLFRITTFGESHGSMLGVVIDGCPSGLELDTAYVQSQLRRRRPGQSKVSTSRNEEDQVDFVSGLFNGLTTGAPITAIIHNKDQRSQDYDHLKDNYRPSHADYTYESKYGIRDHRGGGRSSARETAARVIAGAIAQQILAQEGILIKAYVQSIGNLEVDAPYSELDLEKIDDSLVRCPDPEISDRMIELIEEVKSEGDSLGGTILCVAQGMKLGLGEPVFDRLEADLAKAMLSIPATKGFEIGSGFKGSSLRGSTHNDVFTKVDGKIVTPTNNSGGVQGGISNGMDIYFRVAFKPVATISKEQQSLSRTGEPVTIQGRGRHDPCVVPRAVPIVEAMTALVLVDHLLRSRAVRLK